MNNVVMAWPGFKFKALTLSYDDGVTTDRRMIDILDKCGIKATFNLNSGCYAPEDKVYAVVVLGTEDASAGFTYDGQEYKDGATITTKAVIKASDVQATSVDGTFAVVNVDGLTIYVSYFDADTKFYTIQGGHGGFVSMNSDYTDGGNLLLTNSAKPRDNKGLWAFVSQSAGKYKVYNYSTGLSKVLGITGTEANARATMVKDGTTGYSTLFSGKFNFGSNEA